MAIKRKAREASGWIRAADRLPTTGSAWLIYSANRGIEISYSDPKTWRYDGAFITHWMPLPDIPNCFVR